MEENGSEGIFEVIQTEAAKGKFLADVDFFCISVRCFWRCLGFQTTITLIETAACAKKILPCNFVN
jgi:hypothetical protein